MLSLIHGLLLAALAFVPAAPQKGEELSLFRKYYASARTSADRVEAVRTLEHLADPGVFEALYPRLLDKNLEPDVEAAIVRVLAGFATEAQQRQVLDTLQKEKAEPGKLALLEAVASARWKDRGGVVAALLADKSWQVRRRALEAVVAANEPGAALKLVPLCDDASDALRFLALDALAALRDARVVPTAIAALGSPSRQVRQSAIRALAFVRDTSAVAPLIRCLEKEQGLLRADLAETLASLTSREFGPNPTEWARWWSEQDPATYAIPSAEGVAYLRGHRQAKSGGSSWEHPGETTGVGLLGTETLSREVVFVIDCSGSMEALVTDKERFDPAHYPDLSRMEVVKTELTRTLERLPAYTRFNILAFATDVSPWKRELQTATFPVRCAAIEWVKRLHPIGGASREGLAAVGLPGASEIEKGRTNAWDALRLALGVEDVRTADANWTKVEADTVFFLTDGRPTAGTYVDPDDILREVHALNALRKVVIHTIGIGEFERSFLQRLAEQNGPGTYVDLGSDRFCSDEGIDADYLHRRVSR